MSSNNNKYNSTLKAKSTVPLIIKKTFLLNIQNRSNFSLEKDLENLVFD
jgi:hypothetical protein